MRYEGGRAANPLPVAVMVDSHHEAAAQTDEADDGLERAAVRPKVHNANLGLGGAMGGLDDGIEVDALLQEVEVTVGDGDGVEVFVGGGELDSLPREGVERLEEEFVALFGEAGGAAVREPVVQEDRSGNGRMVEVRERKLADSKVPVGVSGPFDVDVVAIVEG